MKTYCEEEMVALSILQGTGVNIVEAALVAKAALEAGGTRLRQNGNLSVYAEVRASETTALRALKRCKKIIALGAEELKRQEKTVTFEKAVVAALASKAEIVVVCASDDDYATVAPRVKELLGDKAILVVAGAPACAAELEAQGINNFINVKSNVLETLKDYLNKLGI